MMNMEWKSSDTSDAGVATFTIGKTTYDVHFDNFVDAHSLCMAIDAAYTLGKKDGMVEVENQIVQTIKNIKRINQIR